MDGWTDGRAEGQTGRSRNGRTDRRTKGRRNKRTNRRRDGQRNGQTNEQRVKWKDGQTDWEGQKEGRTDGRMVGWTEGWRAMGGREVGRKRLTDGSTPGWMFDAEKEGVRGKAWTNGRRNGWIDFSRGIFNIEVWGELLRAQSVKRLGLLLVRGKKLEIELTDCTNSNAPVLALCLKKEKWGIRNLTDWSIIKQPPGWSTRLVELDLWAGT